MLKTGSLIEPLSMLILTKEATRMNRKVSLEDAFKQLSETQRFATVFTHGTLELELYAPQGHDPQQPHTRDEVYIVASGTGIYVNADKRDSFKAGDFLFAEAGVHHRFEDFSEDFAVWVLFYGPEGGEDNA